MAEIDPVWLQGGNYDASEDRILISALLGAGHWSTTEDLSGVTTYDALKVSANGTPDMSVNVAAGLAIVKGTEATGQGYYIAGNDAEVNRAIAAADNTNDRHDIVYLAVRDAVYSGSDSDCVIGVATGTPAAVPADPDIPENAIPLARVVVQANASSITSGDITDLRTPSPVWTRPRGRIGSASVTANRSSSGATVTDITGLTVTGKDLPAGRIYEVVFDGGVFGDNGAAGRLYLTDGSNTVFRSGRMDLSGVVDWFHLEGEYRSDADGDVTVKARFNREIGTGNMSVWYGDVNEAARLTLTDIGGFI